MLARVFNAFSMLAALSSFPSGSLAFLTQWLLFVPTLHEAPGIKGLMKASRIWTWPLHQRGVSQDEKTVAVSAEALPRPGSQPSLSISLPEHLPHPACCDKAFFLAVQKHAQSNLICRLAKADSENLGTCCICAVGVMFV